jgi:hypothetical protein
LIYGELVFEINLNKNFEIKSVILINLLNTTQKAFSIIQESQKK